MTPEEPREALEAMLDRLLLECSRLQGQLDAMKAAAQERDNG